MARKLAGKVQTVLETIEGSSLGLTLVHEHILNDLKIYFVNPPSDNDRILINQPMRMENLYRIRLHPNYYLDNLCLNDEQVAVKEIIKFKNRGGSTIVEATADSVVGRNPQGLAKIARLTGVNIVMGTGYYLAKSHLQELATKTEKEISSEFVRDITEGVANSGIKAGIIGEIACFAPLTEDERKTLRCCAAAQQLTGAAIYIHPGPSDEAALDIIRVLKEADADLNRVVIGHVDISNFSEGTCRRLIEAGCYIAYDNFGNEGFLQLPHLPRYYEASDIHRINDIIKLAQEGYLSKVLISQDAGTKERLTSYGGTGYAHILRYIVPIMQIKGLSEAQIHTLLVDNPQQIIPLAKL